MSDLYFFLKDQISTVISLEASLKWEKSEEQAKNEVACGHGIVWDVNLDLFSFPLTNDAAFKQNEFTLEYFKKGLYTQFEGHTRGIILYKGSPHFPIKDPSISDSEFQKKWRTHRQGIDFLKSLSAILPESLPIFLFFEEETIPLAETIFDTFCIATKQTAYAEMFPTYGWERPSPLGYFSTTKLETNSTSHKKGILLPPLESIDEALIEKISLHLPAKIIPENAFTQEWEAIETITVFSKYFSPRTKRLLAGFEASGGGTIYINN